MTNSPQYTLRILNIHCFASDEEGGDEVFIKNNGIKVWPEGKYIQLKDSSVKVGVDIKLAKGEKAELEIWEYDYLSKNDLLGKVTVIADGIGGPYTTDLIREGSSIAKYAIEWEIG